MLKALDIWLPAWIRRGTPQQLPLGIRHVILSVCDHFEPFHGVGQREAVARVETWRRQYASLTREFTDADGAPPKHTFFYPIEQYDPDVLAPLADLCHTNGSECEVHLHHDNDTPENLRSAIELGKERFAGHGLLSRDPEGAIRYGFVHGNWALDNSHPHGRHCGVTHRGR